MGENILKHELKQIAEKTLKRTENEIEQAVYQEKQGVYLSKEIYREAERTAEQITREATNAASHLAKRSVSAISEWGKDFEWTIER